MVRRVTIFLIIISIYGAVFIAQEHHFEAKNPVLQSALPAKFKSVVSGYLKQLVSEVMFIKVSVFLGSVDSLSESDSYASPLENNLEVMTKLYPEFVDPYYYTQSFLSPISKPYAVTANKILSLGIVTYPNDFILRFFQAFNYYNYLDLPLIAATAFKDASKIPGAPLMFEHLAAVFSADGGNLSAGLSILEKILFAERNEVVRERYQQEIVIFKKALMVESAIFSFYQKYQKYPKNIDVLAPEFLDEIPIIKDLFVLVYKPPILPFEQMVLRLKRPD